VAEPRQKAKVLYPLPELLPCCLVGVLRGAEGWVEVEEYGEAKLDFLRRFVPFDHGIASHDTFSEVFNALDREGFKAAFIAWTAALHENIREIVAIDGKTLRRSFDRGPGDRGPGDRGPGDRGPGHGPIHMISAWAAGQRLVLGQLAVPTKENEITAIPELLALLSLKGAIVTIDAIGCQNKIAAAIRQRGADYLLALTSWHSPLGTHLLALTSWHSPLGTHLLALKENQPTRYRDVADFLIEQRAVGFRDCAAASWATHQTSDADHGRIQTRRHWITSDIGWLQQRHPAWPDLTSIAMVEAVREEPGKPASRQTRFYITSIAPDAAEFAHAEFAHAAPALGHRKRLHRVLDVIYREDQCRIRKRNRPANFATIRHITLNLLQRTKTTKKKSIRVKRGLAALDEAFLQSVLMAA
jgi:predicted transposase YbfD/YdcC